MIHSYTAKRFHICASDRSDCLMHFVYVLTRPGVIVLVKWNRPVLDSLISVISACCYASIIVMTFS